MQINIISDIANLSNFDSDSFELFFREYPKSNRKIIRIVKYFFISFRFDYFIINFSSDIFAFGLLKLFFPLNKCKFITLDIFLPPPTNSFTDTIKRYIRIICLKNIDMIILYSKNNNRLSKAYKLNTNKLKYIPFKINSHNFVTQYPTIDGDYIFSGGRSRRDFKTLIQASRNFEYNVKIVTPLNTDKIFFDSSSSDTESIPSNVDIIHDDGSIESFVSYIANSRVVVLPLRKDDFASTGSSVYLIAMALKKCVIISAGPTADWILENKAIIVPPENPQKLASAIKKAYSNFSFRNNIASKGYNYAINIGNENRFFNDILDTIQNDFLLCKTHQ